MSNYSVYSGAVGWVHDEWLGELYPEDLPEEWRLPFYNTQFRCVYLPFAMWRKVTDEELANWLQETQEGFRFVLQLPENTDEKAVELSRRFGERGIPEDQIEEILWLEGEPDLRDLAQRMRKAAQGGSSLYLISRSGSLKQLRQVNELMEVLGV